MSLQSGLITRESYKKNLTSKDFLIIEAFNDDFLKLYKDKLSNYNKKWTNDSFHNWSRQYEYPYFFAAISNFIAKNPNKKVRILDAGSGLTFFPYLLLEKFPNVEITCTDYDKMLGNAFSEINYSKQRGVNFVQSDLREKKFQPESFDLIYCISVLEHTSDYNKILENFKSYLVPEGELILSFDISLDGYRDIPIGKAQELINTLENSFLPANQVDLLSMANVSSDKYLTTTFAIKFDKRLSPWRFPYKNFLWSLKQFRIPKFYFETAFYCQVYKNKIV